MGGRRRVVAGLSTLVLVLTASGCWARYSIDDDLTADVVWVVPVGSGDPATAGLELWPDGAGAAVAASGEGVSRYVVGDADGDGSYALATRHGDGWHTEEGVEVFPDAGASGSTVTFFGHFDAVAGEDLMHVDESTMTWQAQGQVPFVFGVPGDVAVPADYDGDLFHEAAVYRPSDGSWWVQGDAGPLAWNGGIGFPAPADYDGDGDDDPGVLGLGTGVFAAEGVPSVQLARDAWPAPADYDGDGSMDRATATVAADGTSTVVIDGVGTVSRVGTPGEVVLPWTVRPGTMHRKADLAAAAETPLDLGGQGNFLGTGRLGYSTVEGSVYEPEGLTLSINGYCTDKIQGDQFASGYFWTEACVDPLQLNDEYRVPNYTHVIELPENRTSSIDVLLFDPGYVVRDRTWTGLPSGSVFANDYNPGGNQSGQRSMDTTFELFQPDATPLDDGDNPSMAALGACATSDPGADGHHTFDGDPSGAWPLEQNTSFFPTGTGAAFYNYSGWFNLCRIPAAAPGGRYLLRVDNQTTPLTRGSNNYAVVARTVGFDALCRMASDPTCPVVLAGDAQSIRGNTRGSGSGNTRAQFVVAEVDDTHAGRTMRIDLWDPAEGGDSIRVLAPDGGGAWGYVPFDWSASDGSHGTDTLAIPVSQHNFNGQAVSLFVPVPAAYPPSGNALWKLEYEYAAQSVTDRTTWTAAVLADPRLP